MILFSHHCDANQLKNKATAAHHEKKIGVAAPTNLEHTQIIGFVTLHFPPNLGNLSLSIIYKKIKN